MYRWDPIYRCLYWQPKPRWWRRLLDGLAHFWREAGQ